MERQLSWRGNSTSWPCVGKFPARYSIKPCTHIYWIYTRKGSSVVYGVFPKLCVLS